MIIIIIIIIIIILALEIQNKETPSLTGQSQFVLEAVTFFFPPGMEDSVPCNCLLQKAYYQ